MCEEERQLLQQVDDPYSCTHFGDFGSNRHWVRVFNVVDGDTFDGLIVVNSKLYRARFRLDAIDAPEIHPRQHDPDHDAIVSAGNAAKVYLQHLIDSAGSTTVPCELLHTDAFGRILCRANVSSRSWNDQMVEDGYAVRYTERKLPWKDRQSSMFSQRVKM